MHIRQKSAFFSFFDIKNGLKKAYFLTFFKNSDKKFAKITKFAIFGAKIGKMQGEKLFAHILFFQDVVAYPAGLNYIFNLVRLERTPHPSA